MPNPIFPCPTAQAWLASSAAHAARSQSLAGIEHDGRRECPPPTGRCLCKPFMSCSRAQGQGRLQLVTPSFPHIIFAGKDSIPVGGTGWHVSFGRHSNPVRTDVLDCRREDLLGVARGRTASTHNQGRVRKTEETRPTRSTHHKQGTQSGREWASIAAKNKRRKKRV